MKRIAILLLAVLLLAGCGRRKQHQEPTDTTNSDQILIPELYQPGSSVEQATGGALKAYPLTDTTVSGIYQLGMNLLIAGEKQLMVVSGERGQVIVKKEAEQDTRFSRVVASATGVAYYLSGKRQVVVLNPQLQEVNRVMLPEDMIEGPIISLTKSEVYYSNGKEVRALHLITGITRLVRQQLVATQSLRGAYFDDSVLLCRLTEGDTASDVYISSGTGQTLSTVGGVSNMQTYGERFVLQQQDGVLLQTVFGTRGTQAQTLALPEGAGCFGVLAMNGTISSVKAENISTLSFYQLDSGKRTAQIALPTYQTPKSICSDGTYVWILVNDDITTQKTMYRWEIAKSAVQDAAVYTAPHYTADKPDEVGLAACQTQLAAMEEKHRIWVAVWTNAMKYAGTHTIVPEHQTSVLTRMLNELEAAITQLPDRFLYETMNRKRMRIALVRSIDDGEDTAQFWKDGVCYILISAKADVAKALYQGIAYAVDSYVIGNSRDYDVWNDLNPDGFAYAYSYDVQGNTQYLSGDGQAFADSKAMSYPHEDRCSIFSNAIISNNSAMFQPATMQAKLKAVCMAIREAYHLEQSTKTYVWEQYLNESLAYVAPPAPVV